MNYYNEFDPHAAAWLRELITAGKIAPGFVDERSIEDVRPDELLGYTQCHFFAGIGGWPLALRLAGWPDDKPVWTGSCPCQPFSAAGKGNGFDDERHLWPAFQWLIQQCRPAVVAGEQVASKAVDAWIDLVQADLEALGYAFGSVPFPAASVGAPHIRDRNYWLGHRISAGLEGQPGHVNGTGGRAQPAGPVTAAGSAVRVADAKHVGHSNPAADQAQQDGHRANLGVSDRGHPAPEGQPTTGPVNGHWRATDWLLCRDGKWRPVEPGTFPLVDGLPRGVVPGGDPRAPGYADKTSEARVMRLKGYGNAIVPQQAAIFIEAACGDFFAQKYRHSDIN